VYHVPEPKPCTKTNCELGDYGSATSTLSSGGCFGSSITTALSASSHFFFAPPHYNTTGLLVSGIDSDVEKRE